MLFICSPLGSAAETPPIFGHTTGSSTNTKLLSSRFLTPFPPVARPAILSHSRCSSTTHLGTRLNTCHPPPANRPSTLTNFMLHQSTGTDHTHTQPVPFDLFLHPTQIQLVHLHEPVAQSVHPWPQLSCDDGMEDWVGCEWGLVEDLSRCSGRKGDIRAGIL
jgi:hypothetical protein